MLKNITKVFSYSIVTNAFGAIIAFTLIRMMSPNQYAVYTMVLAIVSVLTGIMVSAFNRIFIVGYIRFNIGEEIGAFFAAQIVILTIIWLIIWPFKGSSPILYILALFLALALCIIEFLRTDYQRLLIFSRYSQVLLAKTVLFFLLILCAINICGAQIQAWHAILAQAFASLFVALPIILQRKMLKGFSNLGSSLQMICSIILGEYRYLFGYLFVLAFFSQLSVFMLNSLSEKYNVATYGSAVRYYNFLLIGLNSVKAVYLPVIQNAISAMEIKRIFRRHRYLVLLSIPIFLIGCFISEWLIPLIDKGKYPDAIVVFQVLALSAFVSFAFSPHVTVIMKSERFLFLFVLILVGSLMNICINYFLIPTHGALGAACATFITYSFVNSIIFIYSRKMRVSYLSS